MNIHIKKLAVRINLVIICLCFAPQLFAQQTANLNSYITAMVVPPGCVFYWYSTSKPPPSGSNITPLTSLQIASAPPGVYYGAFYDSANNCYSPAARLVVAINKPRTFTVNLVADHTSGTPPPNSVQKWYTDATLSSVVPDPTKVRAGKYYSAYVDPGSECKSPPSDPVVVIIYAVVLVNPATINSSIQNGSIK